MTSCVTTFINIGTYQGNELSFFTQLDGTPIKQAERLFKMVERGSCVDESFGNPISRGAWVNEFIAANPCDIEFIPQIDSVRKDYHYVIDCISMNVSIFKANSEYEFSLVSKSKLADMINESRCSDVNKTLEVVFKNPSYSTAAKQMYRTEMIQALKVMPPVFQGLTKEHFENRGQPEIYTPHQLYAIAQSYFQYGQNPTLGQNSNEMYKASERKLEQIKVIKEEWSVLIDEMITIPKLDE